jgi:hypothetical protein
MKIIFNWLAQLLLSTDHIFIRVFPVTVSAGKPFKLIRIFSSFAVFPHQTSGMSLYYTMTASFNTTLIL